MKTVDAQVHVVLKNKLNIFLNILKIHNGKRRIEQVELSSFISVALK